MDSLDTKQYKYEISFICVTYNSSFDKLKRTLISFIKQEGISFEIIVADDGSRDNHREKIEALFSEFGFSDYKLIMNKENMGTVKNYLSGLNVAEGYYCKSLSPGDYLCDTNTIREWIDALKTSGSDWSFSDAIFYEGKTGCVVSKQAHPQLLKPYINDNLKMKRWNYVVLNDIALGAAILSRTSLQLRYCSLIERHGVKYAEDNMWRLMMFDGTDVLFLNKPTIFYEYGSGISTNNEKKWCERLAADWKKTDELMSETANPDLFQEKMLKSIDIQQSLLGKIITKGRMRKKIKSLFFPRMTRTYAKGEPINANN